MSDQTSNPTCPVAPSTVLVVDDEPSIRQMLRTFLLEDNYEVLEAESALRAREILEEKSFKIKAVLLDLVMPQVSGEEFLEWLSIAAPQVAVVIISGSHEEEVVIRCLRHGASDFLSKPCDMKDVRAVVRRAIKRQLSRKATTGELKALHPTEGWVELTAPSEFEYLTRMQRFSDILFTSRLPQEICEDLRMAMEELGRNAIEWGNRLDRDKQFRISYCFFGDRIVLKFEDEGEGFHPEKVPDPSLDPEQHLKNRADQGKRPGGFGIFLIQRIMDEVVYSEKGNVVLMTKFLVKPTGKK
jgi:DNA-binding response OmpR family regulator